MNSFALLTAGVILIICPESHGLVNISLAAGELAFQRLWLLVGVVAGFTMIVIECKKSRNRKRKQRRLSTSESRTEANKSRWNANADGDQSDSFRLQSEILPKMTIEKTTRVSMYNPPLESDYTVTKTVTAKTDATQFQCDFVGKSSHVSKRK